MARNDARRSAPPSTAPPPSTPPPSSPSTRPRTLAATGRHALARPARRTVLAGALATTLSGCGFFSSGASGASNSLTFWDMPWAGTAYTDASRKVTTTYEPPSGDLPVAYQTIQWSGFLQTFTSAVASKTNPSISTGGGFQAFQFAETGALHMADDLVARLQKDGFADDFLPGLLEGMRTDQGYVAMPWNLDLRPIWYRRSVLEKADVEPPTDWDSWREAAAKLKTQGIYGYSTGAGSGNNTGTHGLISLMIQNGGGLFDENGEPDALYERNLEAMEFIREFVVNGWIDPNAVSYTSDNVKTQWLSGKYAFGFDSASMTSDIGESAEDFEIAELVAGPHGDTGTLQFVNNVMMYSHNVSIASTEAFLEHYLRSLHVFWDEGVLSSVPVLSSIATSDAVTKNRKISRMLDIWQPVAKQMCHRGDTLFPALASLDGGVALTRFTQTMLSKDGDPKKALTALQNGLETAQG